MATDWRVVVIVSTLGPATFGHFSPCSRSPMTLPIHVPDASDMVADAWLEDMHYTQLGRGTIMKLKVRRGEYTDRIDFDLTECGGETFDSGIQFEKITVNSLTLYL